MVGTIFWDGDGVDIGVVDATEYGDGDIKIIFMALSSGTGDRIFLPDMRSPTIMDTKTKRPMITVIAARVRRRSSIPPSVTLGNNPIKCNKQILQ